jgi:hypothetical protein
MYDRIKEMTVMSERALGFSLNLSQVRLADNFQFLLNNVDLSGLQIANGWG